MKKEAKAPAPVETPVESSSVVDMTIIKGKLEFWVNDPDKNDKPPVTHVAIYNRHPHTLTEEQALKDCRQIAEIMPAYMDQFGGSVHITLRADYAVNGEAYHSEVDATYDNVANMAERMYNDLIKPTMEISKQPRDPIA